MSPTTVFCRVMHHWRTLIGSRALSQLHSDSMGTCTGVRPSNSLAVHCLDHGRLLAVDDPLTSSYATNALLPMSFGELRPSRSPCPLSLEMHQGQTGSPRLRNLSRHMRKRRHTKAALGSRCGPSSCHHPRTSERTSCVEA